MTHDQRIEIAGYLTNPKRRTAIEAEVKKSGLSKFANQYQVWTGNTLPTSDPPVHVVTPPGDKWGREMRIYFVGDLAHLPAELEPLITKSNRPGYDQYNCRVNNNDLIDYLLSIGFLLGDSQVEARIRGKISAGDVAAFNNGYNIP